MPFGCIARKLANDQLLFCALIAAFTFDSDHGILSHASETILNHTLIHPAVLSSHIVQLQPVRELGECRSKVGQLGSLFEDVCLEPSGPWLRETIWHTAEESRSPGGQVHAQRGNCDSRGLCTRKWREDDVRTNRKIK